MSATNLCNFIGRVASDIKSTQQNDGNGGTFTKVSFSFAVPKKLSAAQKQQNDQAKASNQPQPHKDASFVLCTASGKVAETISKWAVKGKPLSLLCELYSFPKQGAQNEDVIAFNVVDMGFLPTDNTQNQGNSQNQYQAPQGGYQAPQGGYQAPPQGGYQAPNNQPNYAPPSQGGYTAPAPGYQPNHAPQGQGNYAPPQGGYVVPDEDIPF